MKSKTVLIIAGASIAALVGISLFLMSRSGARDQSKAARDPFQRPDHFINADGTKSHASPRQMLLDYKEWAQFPPKSRPLSEANVDLIELNNIPVPYRPVRYEENNKTKVGNFSCVLQPKYHTVFENEPQLVFLSCYKGTTDVPPQANSLVAVDVKETQIRKVTYKDFESLPPNSVSINDSGRDGDASAGDKIYTAQFRPTQADWGHMQLTVRFTIPDDPTGRTYEMQSAFFASPKAPAFFTGKFTEEIRDGSLFINVEMRVIKGGKFRIQANLKNAEKYIAITKEEVELQPGTHLVPLLFFGRIFHAKEADGPYILTGLYGYRNNPFITDDILNSPNSAERLEQLAKQIESKQASLEPEKEIIPPYPQEWTTQDHRYRDFSDKEYDSARKRLEMEELIKMVPDTADDQN